MQTIFDCMFYPQREQHNRSIWRFAGMMRACLVFFFLSLALASGTDIFPNATDIGVFQSVSKASDLLDSVTNSSRGATVVVPSDDALLSFLSTVNSTTKGTFLEPANLRKLKYHVVLDVPAILPSSPKTFPTLLNGVNITIANVSGEASFDGVKAVRGPEEGEGFVYYVIDALLNPDRSR